MNIVEKCEKCNRTKSLITYFDPPDIELVCIKCHSHYRWIKINYEQPKIDESVLFFDDNLSIISLGRITKDDNNNLIYELTGIDEVPVDFQISHFSRYMSVPVKEK